MIFYDDEKDHLYDDEYDLNDDNHLTYGEINLLYGKIYLLSGYVYFLYYDYDFMNYDVVVFFIEKWYLSSIPKKTKMEQLDVVTMIKREMERKRVSSAELTRALGINHSSVSGMLQRPTIQVQRLAELSAFFNYNFFREIAQKLPYPEPDNTNGADREEIARLLGRVRDLELEVGILRQTIKDLVSR